MKVLITGACGFIGSHVVRRVLQEGHSVWAVLLPGESTERLTDCLDRLSPLRCDLRESAEVRRVAHDVRPDCAIHLAWYAAPGRYWTAPENLECVMMTLSLAQSLADEGCRRLVAAGSCAEYDWRYCFLSEDVTPLRPRNLYGACKNATREALEAYCERVSMEFAWTRFFYLYGPHEGKERLVSSVILSLLKGETARCTDGEQIRDYLHVEDVASAVWAVAKSTLTGAVNIGSGEPVKVRTIVGTIARLLEQEENIALGALPTDPKEPPVLLADIRRLVNKVGWRPSVSLIEGLSRTCQWWKSAGYQE